MKKNFSNKHLNSISFSKKGLANLENYKLVNYATSSAQNGLDSGKTMLAIKLPLLKIKKLIRNFMGEDTLEKSIVIS